MQADEVLGEGVYDGIAWTLPRLPATRPEMAR
jgi:hypothetical protein